MADEGLGFECVSRGELEHTMNTLPQLSRDRLLYPPNFAAREKFAGAFGQALQCPGSPGGGIRVAGSQCSSALPSLKRQTSNHVVV